jgi:hypothetical protein
MKLYYVEQVGSQFGKYPVAHKTIESAMFHARNTAKEAMRTMVWDCSQGPVGILIWDTLQGDK